MEYGRIVSGYVEQVSLPPSDQEYWMRRTSILALVSAATTCILHGCMASTTVLSGSNQINRSPVISTFTANPSNEAKPGQAITFLVAASDPDGDAMQFNWTSTGGTLSTNAGQTVSWVPPSTSGPFSVQVVITDGRGGAATGAQNITVSEGGVTLSPPVLPSPAPGPGQSGLPSDSSSGSTQPASGASTRPTEPAFTLVPMSTGLKVRDFHAFDMETVYAIGFDSNQVVRTRDGGATWEAMTLGKNSLNGLYFQDRLHGWVCGNEGVLFETTDGGTTCVGGKIV